MSFSSTLAGVVSFSSHDQIAKDFSTLCATCKDIVFAVEACTTPVLNIRRVLIEKLDTEKFGLKLKEDEVHGGILIEDKVDGYAASKSIVINVGDRILEANGVWLGSSEKKNADSVFQQANTKAELLVMVNDLTGGWKRQTSILF